MKNFILTFLLALLVVLAAMSVRRSVTAANQSSPSGASLVAFGGSAIPPQVAYGPDPIPPVAYGPDPIPPIAVR